MSGNYTPDRWVVVKITTDKKRLYKVFASWSGGYTGSDSWQMNSGITQATLVEDRWLFLGHSGSVYSCYKDAYGTNGYSSNILQGFINKMPSQGATMEIMPESTDWANLDYDVLQQFIADGVNNV